MRRTFLYLLSGLFLELLPFGNAAALYASDIMRKRKYLPIPTRLSANYLTNFSQKQYYDITHAKDLVSVACKRNGTERYTETTLLGDFDCPANFYFEKPVHKWINPWTQAIESDALTDKPVSLIYKCAEASYSKTRNLYCDVIPFLAQGNDFVAILMQWNGTERPTKVTFGF